MQTSAIAAPAASTASVTGDARRILWLDAARGFAIVLVVLGHTIDGLVGPISAGVPESIGAGGLPGHYRLAHGVIYTFHMPLFFFLSGLVFLPSVAKRTVSQAVWRRVVVILWPYVLWSYLFIGMKFALAPLVNNPMTLTDFIQAPWPPKEHMWFLASLFAIQILAMPLIYAGRYALAIAAGVGCIFLALRSARVFVGTDEFIRETAAMLPFFLLGILYAGLNILAPKRLSIVLVYVAAFLACEIAFFLTPADIRPMLHPFVALIGVLGATQCIRWFAEGRRADRRTGGASALLAMLGSLSMAIYLAHVLFSAGIRIALEQLGVEWIDMHVLAGTLAGVAGPVALYLVLKRFGLTRVFGFGS